MTDRDSKNHDPLTNPAGEALPNEPLTRERDSWSKRLNLFAQNPDSVSSPASHGDSSQWEEIRLPSIPRSQARDPLASRGTNGDALASSTSMNPEADLQLVASRREIADRDAENVGLRDALGAAHHQLRSREAEFADLTTRLAVANATTAARQEELSAVALRRASGDEKLYTLDRELKLMHDKLLRAAEAAENRDTKIENLRATRATLEETLKARDRVISARDEELAAGEQELQAYRNRIATHQKSIADRDSEIAMLSDQLLAHQERAHSLDAEIGGREKVVAQQREKLAQRDEQLASLLATLDVVERTISCRPGVPDLPERAASSPPVPWSGDGSRAARRAPAEVRAPAANRAPAAYQAPAAEPTSQEYSEAIEPDDPPTSLSEVEEPISSEDDDSAGTVESESESVEPITTQDTEAEPEPGMDDSDGDSSMDAGDDEGLEAEAPAAADELEPPSSSDNVDADADAVEDSDSESAVGKDETESLAEAEDQAASGSGPVISAIAFEDELYNLESAGDLFSQRPPPQPPIFRWWRDQQLAAQLPSDEINSFDDLLFETIARECAERSDETIAIWSLSGGDAELELRVARALLAAGHANFSIECLDDRAGWHEIRADLAEKDGLDEKIFSLPASLSSFPEDQQYDVFIADGSLAHVNDLPRLFERIQRAWKDESVMVIGAVLGSGAASSSPENIETVDRIWSVMPDRYMCNYLTGEEQTSYSPSSPASDEAGNGGPLSPGNAPLLSLLLDSFCFEIFAAFGNLINAFVGPEIGLNFDPDDESCRSFIERFSQLDEAQIDSGSIHPLHMSAVLRSSSVPDAIMLENRTPERCLMLEG